MPLSTAVTPSTLDNRHSSPHIPLTAASYPICGNGCSCSSSNRESIHVRVERHEKQEVESQDAIGNGNRSNEDHI